MVAVVYDNAVKIPIHLSGKTGNISQPAWEAIEKELLSGSEDRKLLACRILSADLKHHPHSVQTVLASPSILQGLGQAITCGSVQVEREVCAVVRTCCYEADACAGEAVASSPSLLNGLCRLALKEDPFVVETLSQLSHNNPKVLWLITTMLKIFRVQAKAGRKLMHRFFCSYRTEVEMTRAKRQIIQAAKGAHDPPAAMKSLVHHIPEPSDNWLEQAETPVDRLCDVAEWVLPVKAATMREFKVQENLPLQAGEDKSAGFVKPFTVVELKSSNYYQPKTPPLPPTANTPQRMVDVDYTKRICDVEDFFSIHSNLSMPVHAQVVNQGKQRMCDVDVEDFRPAPGLGRTSTGKQTMVDVDVLLSTQSVPADYRRWQTGRSTAGELDSTPLSLAEEHTRGTALSDRWTRVSGANGTDDAPDESSPKQKRPVEVVPWHKSQRWVMAAMARSTTASTLRLTNHSSHQGVYRTRQYGTVQEARGTAGSICDVEEYLPYGVFTTVETARAPLSTGTCTSLRASTERVTMAESELTTVEAKPRETVMPQPQEPPVDADASVTRRRVSLSVASSTMSTPRQPPLTSAAGRVRDVEEYLSSDYSTNLKAAGPGPRKTVSDWSGVLDATRPNMPIYSTLDEAVSTSINLYSTNPAEHPAGLSRPRQASLASFPDDWSEAINIRERMGTGTEERAWF